MTLIMKTTGVQRGEGIRWAQESCHGNAGAELELKKTSKTGKSPGKVVAGRQKDQIYCK